MKKYKRKKRLKSNKYKVVNSKVIEEVIKIVPNLPIVQEIVNKNNEIPAVIKYPSATYPMLLATKEWAIKRLEIINRDKKCMECGATKGLQVHHTYYYRKKVDPWLYPNSSLITLCEYCHSYYHKYNDHELVDNIIVRDKNTDYAKHSKDAYTFLNLNGTYKLGIYSFNNKLKIRKFCRCILSQLPIDKFIYDTEIVDFVHALFKYHPEYNKSLQYEDYIEVKLNGLYTNFCIKFVDGTDNQFSNIKCIDNIPTILTY